MKNNMQHFKLGADADDHLRRAFGRFGTGVTLITVQTANGPLGMTANSFSSVSLDPALVLWSAGKKSKRHDAFATAAHFAIHVLGADQQDVADSFAADGFAFGAFDWAAGPNGAPTLAGCLATFHCDTYDVHAAGDHSIIVGQVTDAAFHPDADAPALMFEQSRYGSFTAAKD